MKKLFSWLSAVFGFAMFLIAVFAIRKELHGHTVGEILIAAGNVPLHRLFLALALTVLCYTMLTGYDLLAVHALKPRPRWRSIILNSFICHAMSINVGFSTLMGGSIRCHYYLRKGVKTGDVVRIVTFCLVTFWLGFLALGGAVFLFQPPPIPVFIHLPFTTLQPVGMLFLVALAAYLFIILIWKEPIMLRGFQIPVMPAHITIAQIIVAASEWIIGAAVLYALLPHHSPHMYIHLLSFYFLAQVSGLVSQVPSGLGVFESILLAFAPPGIDPSRILASLLLYRLIFNLLPLSVAGTVLLAREVRERRRVA